MNLLVIQHKHISCCLKQFQLEYNCTAQTAHYNKSMFNPNLTKHNISTYVALPAGSTTTKTYIVFSNKQTYASYIRTNQTHLKSYTNQPNTS